MSNKQKSLIRQFKIRNWNIGLKINILVYAILVVSFTIISIVGFNILGEQLKINTYQNLEQITYHKKQIVENEYNSFLNSFQNIFTDDLVYSVEELKSSFKNYSFDAGDRFRSGAIEDSKIQIKDYYNSEILSAIKWDKPDLDDILPQREIEIVLQQIYIVDNKWPLGEKDKLLKPETGTNYAYNHQAVHSVFRDYNQQYKFNNIYLIDNESGDIFYNLNKNIAYGTNLFSGNYRNSALGEIFQEALTSTSVSGELFFKDYGFFIPEYNVPVAYIAMPIIRYNEKVAVAVIEIAPQFLESFVNDLWLKENQNQVEVNILGDDNKYRMNELEQYSDSESYFSRLRKKGIKKQDLLKASYNGGAFILGVDEEYDFLESDLLILRNHFGEKFFALGFPLRMEGFNWTILGKSKANYYKDLMSSSRWKLFLVYLFLLLFASLSLRRVINSIVVRLSNLSTAFISLSRGENAVDLTSNSNDELGQTIKLFNSLKNRVGSAGDFAIKLSDENYDEAFKASSENDSFAHALNTLSDRLRISKEESEAREKEDEKSKWTNEGIAKFNDLLRQSNDDIKALAYLVIENVIEYIGANQGGIFLVEGESDASSKINLIAGFAYDRRKYTNKTIEIGEGLIGNCYLEKKTIHLHKIPEDYIEITSGLGATTPSSLFIVPLIMDEKVLGFMELASLNDFEPHQIEFIEKLAENVAATFSTVKLNTRTAELLEESKRRANEIAQQEEEMRQNMEEMQATQEELARLREEDEKRQKELQNKIENTSNLLQTLINSIKGEVIVKDGHGVVVLANIEACTRYNTSIDAVKGVSDTELLDKAIISVEHTLDNEVIKDGEYVGYRTENVDGELIEYVIEKRPFFIKDKNDTGTITIWKKAEKEVE